MTDQSSANLNSAIEYARNFLSSIGEWSVAINKPVVLEEFGAFCACLCTQADSRW